MFSIAVMQSSTELLRKASIEAAADIAKQELIERYDFYWSIAGIVGTVLLVLITFFGLGAWKNVRASIKSEVMNDLRDSLLNSDTFKREIIDAATRETRADLDAKSSRLERQIRLSKLQYLSSKVRGQSGFSNREREELYQLVVTLKDDAEIVKDVSYINSLEQVIDSFYGASLWERIDDLERELGLVIANSHGIVQTMVMGYALRYFGSSDEQDSTLIQLKKYIRLLQYHKISSMALMLKLALELDADQPDSDRIEELLQDCVDLDDGNRAMLLKTTAHFSDPELISHTPRQRHYRVANAFSKVAALLPRLGLDRPEDAPDGGIDMPDLPLSPAGGPGADGTH